MFGGMGYMNESLISRYFRDSRLLSIGGGADEIMKEVIARFEGNFRGIILLTIETRFFRLTELYC